MTELVSLTQNQTTKLNTYAKTQTTHQVSSSKSHYPQSQAYPPNLLTKKYFKKQYPLTKKHFKIRHTLACKRPKNDNNSTNINKIKWNRKRQIIWFDPPFNLKTKTKICNIFFHLLNKHFPPHNKLHKLFNWTSVKISYSCIPIMNSYIYMHNHKVLNDNPNETGINNCNCHNKDTSPLPNSSQTKCVIFQANIDCDITGYKQKCYLGTCETTSKDPL